MGAGNIGIYSYAYSIATYFGLFILLGLNNYGNRTIAFVRDDRRKLSETFWSIYFIQISMSFIIILIYIGYASFVASNKPIAWIQLIYLISVALDINWFFFGIEQFKLTVTRNIIIKLLNVIMIFLLVKNKNDLYIYGTIMSVGPLLSQFFLWGFLRKYIIFVRVSIDDVFQHIKPNLILFIPVIAISIYTIMDRVMLGVMSTMNEVGYYESSNKLTTIPTMIITSLGTVMLPRMSNLIAKGKKKETMEYIHKSLIISILLSSSMSFGLSAISKEFVPIFYGYGFEKCGLIITILVQSSIFMSWANVIRTQYLIPHKQDTIYIVSVFLGAIINVLINIILIPEMQALGAAIGTLFAELSVCLYQTYMVRKKIKVWKYLKQCIPIIIIGITMYIIVIKIPFIISDITTLIIKIFVGILVYILLFIAYYYFRLKNEVKGK